MNRLIFISSKRNRNKGQSIDTINCLTCQELQDLTMIANLQELTVNNISDIINKFELENFQISFSLFDKLSTYLAYQNYAQAIYLKLKLLYLVQGQNLSDMEELNRIITDLNDSLHQYFSQLNVNQQFMTKLDSLVLQLILSIRNRKDIILHSQNLLFIHTQYSKFVLNPQQDVEEMQILFVRLLFFNSQFKPISDALLKHQLVNQNNIDIAISVLNEMQQEIDTFSRTNKITNVQLYNFINGMKLAQEIFQKQVQICILQLQSNKNNVPQDIMQSSYSGNGIFLSFNRYKPNNQIMQNM